MTEPDDDLRDELGTLLGPRADRIDVPAGAWESVRRRGARRRALRRGATVLAVAVAITAVAVPTALVLRQPLPRNAAPVATATSNPTPLPQRLTHGLSGFQPQSVSFVSQDQGWLSGTLGSSDVTVLARTTDGGTTWSRLAVVPISPSGAGIRFANSNVGFAFGHSYLETTDGGRDWKALPSPGRIHDMETWNGDLFALVSGCSGCSPGDHVYQATIDSPVLHPTGNVPALATTNASLTLQSTAAYVLGQIAGSAVTTVWSTVNGGALWQPRISPCDPGDRIALAQSDTTHLAAYCQPTTNPAARPRLFLTVDGGQHWRAAEGPVPTGTVARADAFTVSATGGLILPSVSGPPIDVSVDGGRTWHATRPAPAAGRQSRLLFAGYISATNVVALLTSGSGRTSATEFAVSHDSGRHWQAVSFTPASRH